MGFTLVLIGSLQFTWVHLGSFWFTCIHLGSLGFTWIHLDFYHKKIGFVVAHILIKKNPPFLELGVNRFLQVI